MEKVASYCVSLSQFYKTLNFGYSLIDVLCFLKCFILVKTSFGLNLSKKHYLGYFYSVTNGLDENTINESKYNFLHHYLINEFIPVRQ